MARLFRVLLPVTDIEAAERFYAHVLGSAGMRVSPGRHYFECEGVILACYDPKADGDGFVAAPNPESLYFSVSDLEATLRACTEAGGHLAEGSPPGVGPLGQIAKRPWGEESFYLQDPFGNQLCFVSASSVFTGNVLSN
jgi:catechol 2,3-dioxygenase-like lactoylglutathione lyase family enzyme